MELLCHVLFCILAFDWLAISIALYISCSVKWSEAPNGTVMATALSSSVFAVLSYAAPWQMGFVVTVTLAGIAATVTTYLAVQYWLGVVTEAPSTDSDKSKNLQADFAKLQQRYDQAQRKLKHLTQISGDWYWQTDEEGRVTSISEGIRRALGRSPEYFSAMKLTDIALTEAADSAMPDYVRPMLERKTFRDCTIMCESHDNSRKTFRISGYPVTNAAGDFVGYYGLASDVTSLIELNDARVASKAQEAFFAMVSHEMRTPLNGVLGLLEVLQGEPLQAQHRKLIDTAEQAGQTLLSLINGMLELSRLQAGHLEVTTQPTDVVTLARETVGALQALAAKSEDQLSFSTTGDTHTIAELDPQKYRQVLFNLIGNAIKFTSRGTISINVDIQKCQNSTISVTTSVRDTGAGIAEADQARIFDMFTMLNRNALGYVQGSGLGLTLAKQLVDAMGGQIAVESALGKGSLFHFKLDLPIAKADALPQQEKLTPMRPELTQGPRHILLAEDDGASALVVQHYLAGTNWIVTHVTNGLEALEAVKHQKFDLVLMDVSMPVMTGAEATAAIRRHEATARRNPIPIVGLTAHASEKEQRTLIEHGMTACLSKPVRKHVLVSKLTECLSATLKPDGGHAEPLTFLPAPAPQASPRHAPASPEAIPVLDRRVLIETMNCDDPEVVARLTEAFADEIKRRSMDLQTAKRNADLQLFEATCHALRGSSQSFGAKRLAVISEKLERTCRDKKSPRLLHFADILTNEIDAVMDAIKVA